MKNVTAKMLILSGVVGLSVTVAATAAPAEMSAPSLTVHYNADTLVTDSGARTLYRRLSAAAEQVCPNEPSNSHLVSEAVSKCRAQAISAAVTKIHNQRLAAVYAASSKSG